MAERQHFIDWLRVITIGLLLIYHIAIVFQSFAIGLSFIQSTELLHIIWIPMTLLNVMRIPLLFFVSGMVLFFSLHSRNWKQVLGERTKRILVPLVFGSIAIVPIHLYIFTEFYSEHFVYIPHPGHLWFLINIFLYVLLFLPLFFYVKRNPNNKFFNSLRKLIEKYPFSIYLLAIPYILESLLIPADFHYNNFFFTEGPFGFTLGGPHGLILGAIAFLLGFSFIALGEIVWKAISKIKYFSIGLAFILFLIRLMIFENQGPHLLTAIESISWVIGAFGLGYTFLNRPSKTLNYLSQASYPFYIIHMVFLSLGAYIIFPLNLGAWISLLFIIVFTFVASFLAYDLIIRRIFFLRPLFGLK